MHTPQIIDTFISYLRYEQGRSELTTGVYSRELKAFAGFITGDNPANRFDPLSVTTDDVRLWIDHLSRQGISRRTVRKKLSAVSSFYRFLIHRREATFNPVDDIAPARLEKNSRSTSGRMRCKRLSNRCRQRPRRIPHLKNSAMRSLY